MSLMLYPCMLCVSLLRDMFVLCVACLTVVVNCLVNQFAMCLGVIVILLLNVMEVFSVGEGVGAMLNRQSMVFQCCACDHSVNLKCSFHMFCYVFVCQKLSPHLRV